MTRFSFSSLRLRLLLLVLLAIIPALGLILYTSAEMRRTASVEAQANALRLARSAANKQDDYFEGARQLLTALAQLPEVRRQDSEACNALFARLLKQFPLYASLGAVDARGDVFCTAVPVSKPVNAADRAYFQRAVQYRDFAVGDYTIGRVSGKASLNFGYPVLDDKGAVQAVVLAGLDLSWLNKVVAKAQLMQDTTLTVIDRKGTILVRYPDPDKWVGKSMPNTPLKQAILSQAKGTAEASGMDGVVRLYGFSPLGTAGDAHVSIGVPKDVAFAPANRVLARNLVALGVVAVLALLAAWFGADLFLLRRVNDLVSTTKRLSAGDLSARTEVPYGKGELSELSRTFDQMAASMEQLIAERKRAEQRLASLHEINVATTSSLDLHAVLSVLMEKIDLFLPYTAVLVWLRNRESGLLERAACRNFDEEDWKGRKLASTPSLVKAAMESKAPVVARNVQTDPRTLDPELFRRQGLVSYLGVPLLTRGEVLGVLVLLTRKEHEFVNEEIEFLSTLASQAAIAIYNSQLYEQTLASKKELDLANQRLARLLGELSGLYAALTPLTPAGSLNQMLERVVEKVMEATGADAALIRIMDNTTSTFVYPAQVGFPSTYLESTRHLLEGSAIALAFRTGEPVIAANITEDPRLKGKRQIEAGLKSCAFLPLRVAGEMRGVIHLASREIGYFHEEQKEHLMAIARQMGIAIENRELLDRISAANKELEKVNSDLRRREEIQKLLKELSQDITSLNMDSLVKKLTGKVREVLKVDVSDARIVEKGVWHVIGASGIETHLLNPPGSGTKWGLSNWSLEHRRPLVIDDIMRTDLPTGTTLKSLGFHGYLGAPLLTRSGEAIGVLRALTYEPREFTQEEADLLQQLANEAAVALENSRLLEQIKRQSVELEKAGKVKDEFLGFVSHELRSPLNAVVAYAMMMQDKLLGALSPEQERALQKMLRYSKELLEMINSLLEVTRIQAGGVEVQSHRVDLPRFLEEIKSAYEAPTGKPIALKWDIAADLPAIRTDGEKLRHILQNLITNAIKYTEQGSVSVSVQRSEGDDRGVSFQVADTGVGIPAESLSVIFEMFRQVDRPDSRSSTGVGLGLHIVKQFTEMLGGKIDVKSEVGRGSTFTVTIPTGHETIREGH